MNASDIEILTEGAISHLKDLISTPSFSGNEKDVSDKWVNWLSANKAGEIKRLENIVYVLNSRYDPAKPLLLLNSHMDTVKPVSSYTRDPFSPDIEDGKLYGLGSNDAGGAGVALAATFLSLKDREDLKVNLMLAITACEENMGEKGMRLLLPFLKENNLYPAMAIVGEPTGCNAAVAERGLVVCDCYVEGVSGHAARDGGVNAIYRAIEDIEILRNMKWEKESDILGPVKVSVTMIDAGTQHNVIPDKCHYVADIRTTDAFTNEETVDILNRTVKWSKLVPRSTRIRASVIPLSHPLTKAAVKAGCETFVSPTTSDMALMYDFPSIKIGPGMSERSHTADEFIKIEEIKKGIQTYRNIILSLE